MLVNGRHLRNTYPKPLKLMNQGVPARKRAATSAGIFLEYGLVTHSPSSLLLVKAGRVPDDHEAFFPFRICLLEEVC